MMGYGWGMGAGGWIAMVIFWIALIVLIVWIVARLFPTGRGPTDDRGGDRPEDILDRRYARGEIDRQTYQEMRDDMTSGRQARR
jgi:putative membrane protein